MPAIEAEDVVFSFGPLRVLRGVTVRVERGEVLALVGPNGAGKTTFLKILGGLLRPDTGRVRLEGVELVDDPVGFRRLIGVISHQPYVYPRLSGQENLEFYARLYGVADAKAEAGRMLEEMGLAAVKKREASTYSRGMLQRLAIGRALLHDPRVLLLDEPFTGLDQQAREKLEALLGVLRNGERAVLLTTHDFEGCLGLAGRVAVLAGGKIALDVPAAGLGAAEFAERYKEATAGSRGGGAAGAPDERGAASGRSAADRRGRAGGGPAS